MKRDAVLAAASADCLQMFASLLAGLPKRIADKAFAMAYKTTNFTEHRLFLDAFSALNSRAETIEKRLHVHLSALLERSIQTAYNPRRTSAMLGAGVDDWSLVDGDAIDTEIRLHKITGLFHARSGDDIRTLNLRAAALFDQDTVKERENPFRPYLFSRCILEAVSDLRLPPDVTELVIELIATELTEGVAEIYQSLNNYFESQGIPARLIVKLTSPGAMGSVAQESGMQRNDLFRSLHSPARTGEPKTMQADTESISPRDVHVMSGISSATPSSGSSYVAAAPRAAKLEQLLRMVRKKAGQPGTASEPFEGTAIAGSAAFHGTSADPRVDMSVSMAALENHAGAMLCDGWISSDQVAREKLQSLFAVQGARAPASCAAGHAPIASAAPPSLEQTAVYLHLTHAYVPSVGEIVDSAGEVRNLIFESRANLQSKAGDIDEMMTIDVVGMIFEFILRDTQVPAEIRAQLGRLQFHMLKIALIDPQLLSQKNHPARKLINRIGTVSSGLKVHDPFTQQFAGEVQRIVEAMLADETGSIALVSKLSEQFEEFVAQHLRSGNANVAHAVEAIETAERRSAYFSMLRAELGKAFAALQVDPYLKEFIEQAWLSAIEKAECQDVQLGRRYRALVPELLWSVLGKPNERERSRLLAHLPQMLFDLKAGLGTIRYQERQAFLSWLVESHTTAIKGTGFHPEQASLSTLRKRFHAFIETTSQQTALTSQQAALNPADRFDHRFIRDAAEEMNLKLDEIETIMEFGNVSEESDAADARTSGAAASSADFGADEVLSRLRVGVPIEVNVDGAPRKAQLNWLNAGTTNMVLMFENKEAPTTISVGLFRRLLANERARFIEAEPLFERAVAALLDAADRVDEIFQ